MLTKKAVSLIMALLLVVTACVVPAVVSAQDADLAEASVNTTADYNLASSIPNGNILHAFNWRMRDLVKYAPDIAAAGYTSVQISPIQTTKKTANDGSYATDWWSFYQPTDYKIGNALGTQAELKAAADELHKYGVKIIADVVTNHLQNCEDRADYTNIADEVKPFQRRSGMTVTNYIDNTRVGQTTTDLGSQLLDMNTENKQYQNYLINNLFNPMCASGVDGFRFDAAKHIATQDDSSCKSDYWPTITSAIRSKNSNAFIYGEVLNLMGQGPITGYTKNNMSVTDYAYGNTVRSALVSKNASNLANYGWNGIQKNQNVLWVESHDTFCDGTSLSLSKKQQIVGWAAIGARKDAPALFFVRPKHEALDSPGFIKYDDLMGAPGSAETWKDPTVVAVNQFKNAFVGQDETVSSSGANFFVQRGTSGMVIVNLNASSTSISQSCTMANGSYTDQVSGATFQVSGGKITGTVGNTGVAVVYNKTASNSAPAISLKLDNVEQTPETLKRYTNATATVTVTLTNATGGTVKVSNLSEQSLKNGANTIKLNSSIPYGKSVDIKITATNGSKTISRTYNIKKKNPNETKKVYFDNSVMKFPEVYVFCKTGEAANTQIDKYDAFKLTGSTTGILSYTVPAQTNYVKFNEGFIGSQYTDKAHVDQYGRCHLFHSFNECGGYCGRTMPETVVNYGTANNKANREKGGYQLVGAMILRDLRFEDYGDYPVATLSASDVTFDGSTTPTEPNPTETTVKPTESQPVPSGLLRGDTDLDKDIAILDATAIQRYLAKLETLNANQKLCADADNDSDITIMDATAIQRYIAKFPNEHGIGQDIGGSGPIETLSPEIPTEPESESQDTPDVPQTKPLKNDFVAVIYCEDFGTSDTERNKEVKMDKNSATLTYDFIGASYVFVRNYDTGVQYCTNGWAGFVNPVKLENYNTMIENGQSANFNKMYVPAGTHTLYLLDNGDDTFTLGYTDGTVTPGPGPEIPTETTHIGGEQISFLLTDNFNWGAAYVYAWDANGKALNGEWPGASQAETITNDFGQIQFRCYVPAGAVGVILNNGKGEQTEDITDFGTYDGYWMDGKKNEKGHYLVTGWNA